MATGFISFPGIVSPSHMIATRTTGARPNIAMIWAAPYPGSPDTSGTATLSFGFNGVTVNWTGALCDKGTLQVSTAGCYQVFQVQDRRWRWKYNWITSAYNVRMSDGSIDSSTQKTVAEIAYDIFSAMGESAADLSQIDSTDYPEFILDRDNCVDAIEELLIGRGYVISLNADDTVTVYKKGNGGAIPNNSDVTSVSFTLDPPEYPYYLSVVMGRTIVQSKLLMIAVGLDTDGSIKPVASLSYMPSGGWDGTNLETFDSITDPIAKELALRTVGKWYQVASQADGTLTIPGYAPDEIEITSISQMLPLNPYLTTTYTDPFGKARYDLAYVEGTFYVSTESGNPPKATNSDAFSRVERKDWTLNEELGIVMFHEPAVKKSGGTMGTTTFADVYLTCSYSVHDNISHVKDRRHRSFVLGGSGEAIFKLEELQRLIEVQYTPGTGAPTGAVDNSSIIDAEADDFLDAAATKYDVSVGNLVIYRGIYPYSTDGVNLQIRWDCAINSMSPFATHVAQYVEALPQLPTERDREVVRRSNMAEDARNQRNRMYHEAMTKVRQR